MNTFQLSCFLAVAEHLNFARAAAQLHVTHPAVSQQIQSLEKELNTTLFQRTTRSVKLTKEGKVFLNDAQQILAISERAKKRFNYQPNQEIETLALGCYNYPCLFLLSEVLKHLFREFPALHPRLQVVPFQHIYRLLEEGDIHAVIGFKEPDSAKISAAYTEVAKIPLICICPKEHPLSQRQSISLDDLSKERLVLFTPPKISPQFTTIQGQLMGDRSPSEFYFCESGEAITVLVNAGFGISVLPNLFIENSLSITTVPVEGINPVSFGIYYKSLQNSKLLRPLIRELKQLFSQN